MEQTKNEPKNENKAAPGNDKPKKGAQAADRSPNG